MTTNTDKNAASVSSSAPRRSRSHRHVQEVIERIFAKRNASANSRRHSDSDHESGDTDLHRR
jgi:hypothetical protein